MKLDLWHAARDRRTTYETFVFGTCAARTPLYAAVRVRIILHIDFEVGSVVYRLDGSLKAGSWSSWFQGGKFTSDIYIPTAHHLRCQLAPRLTRHSRRCFQIRMRSA
jgi:hypothetical protein